MSQSKRPQNALSDKCDRGKTCAVCAETEMPRERKSKWEGFGGDYV